MDSERSQAAADARATLDIETMTKKKNKATTSATPREDHAHTSASFAPLEDVTQHNKRHHAQDGPRNYSGRSS
eukprot:8576428-Pyramimonas_sp.AAC.1